MKSSLKFGVFWSSNLSKINGQNIVSKEVLSTLSSSTRLVKFFYNPGLGFHIISYFCKIIHLYKIVLIDRPDFIYLVCSRSIYGFVRDIPLLILSKLGSRLIVHVHGSDFKNLFSKKWIKLLSKYLYENCEIIVPSLHLLKNIFL